MKRQPKKNAEIKRSFNAHNPSFAAFATSPRASMKMSRIKYRQARTKLIL